MTISQAEEENSYISSNKNNYTNLKNDINTVIPLIETTKKIIPKISYITKKKNNDNNHKIDINKIDKIKPVYWAISVTIAIPENQNEA